MLDEKIEIIEYIMQLRISDYIKNNRDIDKKELAKNIDKMLEEKENMYNMDKEELEKILRKEK